MVTAATQPGHLGRDFHSASPVLVTCVLGGQYHADLTEEEAQVQRAHVTPAMTLSEL